MKTRTIVSFRLRNLLHTLLYMGGMLLLLGLVGYLLAGQSGLLWAAGLGLAVLFLAGQLSPGWILRLYRARPLTRQEAPGLYRLLETLAREARLPALPELYLVPGPYLNAFAVGNRRQAAIGLTTGLLQTLNGRELRGVLAHEISHVRHQDGRVMAFASLVGQLTRFFALVGQLLLFFNLPLLLAGRATISWLAILLLLAAPTLSGLLQLALARTREHDADLGAVRLTGDPAGLAAALQKMEQVHAGWWRRWLLPRPRPSAPPVLRTHPDTSERVARLMALAGGRPGMAPAPGRRPPQAVWLLGSRP